MSKKDYEKAAAIIRTIRTTDPKAAPVAAAAFVLLFTDENPRFDSARFLQATGANL